MAWDEIKFKISADMDFGDAINQVNKVKDGINELKGSITDMPNASKILNNSLERTSTIASSLTNKLSKLENGKFNSESEKSSLEKSISNDIAELNTLKSLQSGNGSFSVSLAKSWFAGLPSAVQKELDTVVPRVSAIIRSRMNSLHGVNSNAFKGRTQAEIANEAMADPEIKAVANQFLKSKAAKQQYKSLITDLIPHVTSSNILNPYQLRRYGSLIQKESAALAKGNVIDIFPESFKQAFKNKGYSKRNFSNAQNNEVLNADSIKELNQMLANSPIMAKAAITAGIGRRDYRGVLETKKEISRGDWENYRAALYDELMTRVAGYGKGKISPYSTIKEDVDKIASRLTSSTSGDTMVGMHNIEKYENANLWTKGTGSKQYTKIRNEGRRAMDEYVVTKYSPFLTRSDGKPVEPKEVMISESHNTRLLGQNKWKNNDDVSDTIALISLAGYDPSDKAQETRLLDLYKHGKVINGKQYIAQSTHGKGEDQVIRMIEKSAYDRVAEQEAAWAKTRKINGSYWNGFEDEEINRKIREGTITATDWGKHLEMQNKAWTPTTDVGIKGIGNKRIAVVDFNKMGDGATWVSNRMMADSGQIRMAIGGKGSAFVFDGKNIGEFGAKTGIADEQGRVMMRGPDGKLFDVSGYDMIMPLDVIKNQGAYKDENGNFVSGERASEIATAFARRYGIGMMANYSKEDISSHRLGTQMSSFINFSPEIQQRQISLAMKRMQELDTEDGQLKYVFGDQNDWLSKQVNADPQLLNTAQAIRRVDAYKQSLMRRITGGEYVDFGDADSGIANMRLAASPLASYLMSHGGIDENGKVLPATIAKAREYLGKEAGKYTDEQISNMIVPDKNTVLDFAHKEREKVAVIRSPTGYGNMVAANNIAAAAEPIYKGFGIATDAGIYVSQDHLKTLQSADYDADQAKVIYDEALRKSVEDSLKSQVYKEEKIDEKAIEYTKEQLADRVTQATLRAGRAAEMPLGMGTGSSGIRIMQLDLSKPQNQGYIDEARRLASYYDNRTVYDKNAKEMQLEDVNAWNTLKLGKEYTKFSDNVEKLFSFEDDLLDENNNPTGKDVFTASNGKTVNLRRLREMGVDNINLPAAFMANHMAGVAQIGQLYRAGMVNTSEMDAISEAMDQIGYGDAGEARQKLMHTMRHMLTEFGTGQRQMITGAESRAISEMGVAAMNELEADSERFRDKSDGLYHFEGRTYKDAKSLANARAKYYGINTARNAIGSFGMTEDRLRFIYGDKYSDVYQNSGPSSIELTAADRLAVEIDQKDEDIQNQIKEIEHSISSKKGRKTAQKKASVEQKLVNSEIEALSKQLNISDKTNIDDAIAQYQEAIKADEIVLDLLEEKGSPEQIAAIKENISKSKDTIEGYNKYKALLQKRDELNKTPEEKLKDLYAQRDQIQQEKELNMQEIAMRSEYNQILSDAREFGDQVWVSQKGKENKINDSKTAAEKYWGRNYWQGIEQLKPLDAFEQKLQESNLNESVKTELQTGLNLERQKINENINKDFTNQAILYAKNVSEEIATELDKQQNAPSAQKQKIDSYDQKIKDASSYSSFMTRRLSNGDIDDAYKSMYENAIIETNKYIDAAETAKEKLIQEYTTKNEKAGQRTFENLQIKFGVKQKNSLGVRSDIRKEEIQNARDVLEKQHEEGLYSDEAYNQMSSQLDALEQKTSKVSIATQDMLNRTGQFVGRIAQRLGRQLFQKALQETKRFIKEFDSSMNEIQAITLKSNTEMQGIRSQTINKALGLRTSVSNVSNVEAMLYRQGLSDAEVSSRTESIIKFATVTKLNVQEATKIITTALQNDLVPSAEAAMDALVALGDSAATTAAEIGKGMQKAAASAKVAGVSYAELTALLTIGTSDTQLSGTQVGTALQTVFSRMRRMSVSGWTADQNGEKTTASSAEEALASVGVDLWDNKAIGKMRTAYDVLLDLSKVWQNLSDAQKNIVMNAMAGTRQTNVFSTLMEGMSEDNGATLEKYLGLAEGSEGITQTKYEIAMQSLSAAMDELRSSWDAVVESFTNSGMITGALDLFSGLLQTIANAGDIGQGFSVIIGGIAGISAALVALSSANPHIAALAGIIGLVAGLAATGGVASIAGLFSGTTQDQKAQQDLSYISKFTERQNKTYQTQQSAIEDVKKAGEAWQQLNSQENEDALRSSLSRLESVFPGLSSAIQSATKDLAQWKNIVTEASDASKDFAESYKIAALEQHKAHAAQYGQSEYEAIEFETGAPIASKTSVEKEIERLKTGSWYGTNDQHKINASTLVSIMKSDNAPSAKLEITKYLKNAFPEALSIIDKYGYGHVSWGEGEQEDLVALDAAYNGFINYMNRNLAPGQAVLATLRENPDIAKHLITDEGYFNSKIYSAYSPETKTRLHKNLYDTSEEYKNWANEYYANNPKAIKREILDAFVEQELLPSSKDQFISLRAAGDKYVQKYLDDSLLGYLANEQYSEKEIRAAFETYVGGILKNDYTEGVESEYYDAKGRIKREAVEALIEGKHTELVYNPNKVGNFVSEYTPDESYSYFIGKGANKQRFLTYADAEEAARRQGISPEEIKDRNGNRAYQTVDQLISAQRQQANATNEQQKLQRILYGQQYNQTTEDLAKVIAGSQREGEDNSAYQMRIRGIAQQLTAGTIDTKAYMPGGIREYESLDAFKSAYSKFGLNSELANVISNTPEALIGYLTNDYETFAQALENAETGKTTPQSQAAQMRNLMNLLARNTGFIKTLRTDEDLKTAYSALQSYFGDNTDSILNAMLAGNYTGTDFEKLVNETISSKGIALGTGRQFIGTQTAQLARELMAGNYSSLAAAQTGMTGWTTDEWSAIESKYPDLKRYLELTPEQRASQEGQNLLRNVQVQLSVSGVSELEEANKILEGTTSLIQNLQKGGEIAIKAKLEFEQGLYNTQQQATLLENGNATEQLQAIMDITGLSKTRVQKMGIGQAKNLAQQMLAERNGVTAASLDEIAKENPELAAMLANAYGFTLDKDVNDALAKTNAIYGNMLGEVEYDKETGSLKYKDSKYNYVPQVITDYFNSINTGSYKYTGNSGNIDREDLLYGLTRSYTPAELYEARKQIMEGTLTSKNATDYELYSQAAGSLTQNQKDYIALKRTYDTLSHSADSTQEELTKASNDMAEARAKAYAEDALWLRDEEERQALEDARLNATTAGGALAYQKLSYEQQNKGAIAAESIFASLANIDPKSPDAFKQIMDSVNSSQASNWKELINSSPDLAKKLTDMGVAIDGDNLDFSQLESAGIDAADVLVELMNAAAGASDALSTIKPVESVGEQYDKAMDFLNGNPLANEEAGFEALSSVYGNDALARVVAYNRSTANNAFDNLTQENGYYIDSQGNRYTSREEFMNSNYDKYAGLDEFYREYAEMKENNSLYGSTELTDMQRLEQLQKIITAAEGGGLENLRSGDKVGAFADITSGIEDFDKWERAVESMQSAGLSLKDFKTDSKEFETAIKKSGITVEEFADINKDLATTIKSKSITALNLYGKESEKVASIYKKLNGTTEEQLEAQKQITKDRLNLENATYYTSGQGSKDYKKVAKDFLGYSKDELSALERELGKEGTKLKITQEAELQLEVDRQQVINDANAVLQSTIDSLGTEFSVDDIRFLIGGTYDISALSAMAAEAEGAAAAIINTLLANLGSMGGAVTFNLESDGKTLSISSSTLSGKKGGAKTSGGGGGGGHEKSALEKALERIKHQVAEVEHQSKLLQLAYEGFDYVNDFGSMDSNIDEQISKQQELAGVYSSSIAELEAQRASLAEGDEEWYKATDAILQYEEALAGVNNTINKLRSARITILEERQEYERAPKNYKGSMLEKHAQRYQITDRFEAYESITNDEIQNYKDQIDLNKAQITQWEILLRDSIRGSDDAEKIKQKIWDKKVENEQLQNDVLSAQLELSKARVDQIAKDMQNSIMSEEHANDVLGTYAGMYESTEQFSKYRNALETQTSNLEEIKKANEKAAEDLRIEIDSLAGDDPAREYAIQALYERENNLAQIEAEMLANQQSIEESFIAEIGNKHEQREKAYEHENKLLDEALKKYQDADDYLNQRNIMEEMVRNTNDQLVEARNKLEDYLTLQASGKIAQGDVQWKNLQDAINETEESIASLENKYIEAHREMQELSFENILRTFQEGNGEDLTGSDQLQHERNLIGYEQTRYQNRGELGNVGLMIQADRVVIDKEIEETEREIKALEQFKKTVEDNPQLYKKTTEEIRKQEEALSKLTVEQEKNTKSLEKNQEAIRQARMKVENESDKAIRSIIQKEKNMLSATVNIQNSILDTIRNNYKEQWDLEKKTIEKKKQALNEEKNLLTERLNFRKKMMDQESNDEELAEYKRQLALISADTTRTKDANELRRKIADMEKEQALQDAQDIANAEIKTIDDRSKAWDNYVAVQEEDLSNLLANANNFREKLDELMSGSFDDFVSWNMQYNKNYINATEEQRKQMEEGWDDTWYNMLGLLRTYWDDVDESMRTKEGFLSILTSTDEFNKLSETGRESYLYNMGELYDNFTASLKTDAAFDDQHEILNTLTSLKDWTFKVQIADPAEYLFDPVISAYEYLRSHAPADAVDLEFYEDWGKVYIPPVSSSGGEVVASSGGGPGNGSGNSIWYVTSNGEIGSVKDRSQLPRTVTYTGSSYSEVAAHKPAQYNNTPDREYTGTTNSNYSAGQSSTANSTANITKEGKNTQKLYFDLNKMMKNAEGGLVDYTGLTWVDGTLSRPESFLDATDTELLRNMLDSFNYVKTAPHMTHVSDNNFGGKSVNVGDVNVNLYEAKLEKDADYDAVARKVGKAFTKQLEKGGLNLAGYNW